MTTSGGIQETSAGRIDAADILTGFQTFVATAAATTIITVPINRIWVGTISIVCVAEEAAAVAAGAQATCVISTSGSVTVPAAGNYIRVDAIAGTNTAASVNGTSNSTALSVPFVLSAGNASNGLIQATVTIAGSLGQVSVTAAGLLQ